MAGFQAVDLDSILDEFESEQNEAEKDNESSNTPKLVEEDNKKENVFGNKQGLNLVNIFCLFSNQLDAKLSVDIFTKY